MIKPKPRFKKNDIGNTKIANMLVMGAYIGYTNPLPKEVVYESLKAAIKRKRLIEINEKAVDAGYEFGKSNRK